MPALNATLHKLREITTCGVVVFFLLPTLWASYVIALWGILCLAIMFFQFKQISRTDIKNTLIYSSPFLLLFASLQLHGGGGTPILERSMSFFIFPVCIFLSGYKIGKTQTHRLNWIFVIGCCLLAVKGPLMYLFIGDHFPYSVNHDFIYRYRVEFNANTQISPTYASIYFGFAVIWSLLRIKEFKKNRGMLFFLLVFLGLNMVILSAKMPVLATVIVLAILFFRKQISFGKGSKKILVVVGSSMLAIVLILFFFTRWGELIKGFGSGSLTEKENSVDVRRAITQCDLELAKEYFLLGTGPQHLQKKLDQCYYQFEGGAFDRNQFNSHNQYLDYLLSHGFIGLILLLVVMIIPLYHSVKRKDPILFSFLLLIILCMLTENILSRQAGIVFYCLFNAMLINGRQALSKAEA